MDRRRIDFVSTLTQRGIPLAERSPPVIAPSKRPLSVPRDRAIVTLKGAVHAPGIAAEMTHATVLFADMRGYTGLAERLRPVRVVSLLDEFFGILSIATEAHGGEVFHMAGDGMMAGFGVRDPGEHGAREALAAGRAMLRRFSSVATRWQRELSIEAGIGVGLHLGE